MLDSDVGKCNCLLTAGATAPAIRGLEALLSSADSENRASIGFRKE